MSQIIPLLTLMFVCTWYEESNPWGQGWSSPTCMRLVAKHVNPHQYVFLNFVIVAKVALPIIVRFLF